MEIIKLLTSQDQWVLKYAREVPLKGKKPSASYISRKTQCSPTERDVSLASLADAKQVRPWSIQPPVRWEVTPGANRRWSRNLKRSSTVVTL